MHIEDVLKKIATEIKRIATDALDLGTKVKQILTDEKPVTADMVTALEKVVSDLETLVGAAVPAVAAKGENISTDVAVWDAVSNLISDYQPLSQAVSEALAILERDVQSDATPTA